MQLPCPVPTCPRTMPGHLTVCGACSAELLRDLADVPSLDLHLDLALTRQSRLGGRAGGRPAEAALPYDPRASAAITALRSALVGWQRQLGAEQARFGPLCRGCDHPSCLWVHRSRPPADTMAAISRWLVRQRAALLAHPALPEAVDELGAAVRQARRVIDRPADRVYAGPCNECGQDLLATPGHRTVVCRGCCLEYNVADRQDWMRREIEDQLAHSIAISGMLRQLGVEIAASTIRYLAQKGRITARGTDRRGRPLYRVGDVLETHRPRNAGRSR